MNIQQQKRELPLVTKTTQRKTKEDHNDTDNYNQFIGFH